MPKHAPLYWDACAWLGLINGEEGKRHELEIIYNFAKKGNTDIWTSTYTLMEVRRLKDDSDRKPWPAENLAKIQAFFDQPFVKLIPVDTRIAYDAQRLFRETQGLSKAPDAVHLASALWWSITTMHTYDYDDLIHLSGKFTCRNGKPPNICEPMETTHGPLFAKT